MIASDFNASWIYWTSGTSQQDAPNKALCVRMINISTSSLLDQLVKEPTRQKAVLDLFGTNKPGLVKSVYGIGISDHDGSIIVDTALRALINKKNKNPPVEKSRL